MKKVQKNSPKIMCIEEWDVGGGRPHPRCLASLPHNIEELIKKFKTQEKPTILTDFKVKL